MTSRSRPLKRRMVSKSTTSPGSSGTCSGGSPFERPSSSSASFQSVALPYRRCAQTSLLVGDDTPTQHGDAELGHLLVDDQPVQRLRRSASTVSAPGAATMISAGSPSSRKTSIVRVVIAEARGQPCHPWRVAVVLEQLQPLQAQLLHDVGSEQRLRRIVEDPEHAVLLVAQQQLQ